MAEDPSGRVEAPAALLPAAGKGRRSHHGKARPVAAPPPPAPDVSLRTVESAWQGLWVCLRLVGGLAGFECDCAVLPAEEARADAAALLPIVQRHPWIARVLGLIGAPVVILQRIGQHFRRRPPKAAPPKPSAVAPAPSAPRIA